MKDSIFGFTMSPYFCVFDSVCVRVRAYYCFPWPHGPNINIVPILTTESESRFWMIHT